MEGKQILGFLNYLAIGMVFILGLVSLLLSEQKKKLTFLFLMFLSAGMMSFLFFAGLAFIFPAISVIGFCIVLYLSIQNQEFFSTGKLKEGQSYDNNHFLKKSEIIINIVLSILIVVSGSFLFYIFNNSFYKNINQVSSFNTATLQEIIENMSKNYLPLILIIISALFMSVIWFIAILKRESKKN